MFVLREPPSEKYILAIHGQSCGNIKLSICNSCTYRYLIRHAFRWFVFNLHNLLGDQLNGSVHTLFEHAREVRSGCVSAAVNIKIINHRCLRSKADDSACQAIVLACRNDRVSWQLNITLLGSTEVMLNPIETLEENPPLGHQYKMAAGAIIFRPNIQVLKLWLQPFKKCLVNECGTTFSPWTFIRK